MKIYAAPLQGFTEAYWRQIHQQLFGGVEAYYTPFVRLEAGEFRKKDLRDIDASVNDLQTVVPQMILNRADELNQISTLFIEQGYRRADINLGCPFPLITKKHKGSGILPYPDEVEALLSAVAEIPQLSFSVKMRLGFEKTTEWQQLISIINQTPLHSVTLHPRVGKQQYKGVPDLEQFAAFAEECTHPLIYNGDIVSVADIESIASKFPKLNGVMIGRGLLARPEMAMEYSRGESFPSDEKNELLREFHNRLFDCYENSCQGDTQILNKIKPYWDYFMPDANRKHLKTIHKATTITKYQSAVTDLFNSMV